MSMNLHFPWRMGWKPLKKISCCTKAIILLCFLFIILISFCFGVWSCSWTMFSLNVSLGLKHQNMMFFPDIAMLFCLLCGCWSGLPVRYLQPVLTKVQCNHMLSGIFFNVCTFCSSARWCFALIISSLLFRGLWSQTANKNTAILLSALFMKSSWLSFMFPCEVDFHPRCQLTQDSHLFKYCTVSPLFPYAGWRHLRRVAIPLSFCL